MSFVFVLYFEFVICLGFGISNFDLVGATLIKNIGNELNATLR
jgi:hypothetical protein